MARNSTRILPETLRTLAFGSIAGTYTAIGTALTNAAHAIILQNTTNQLLTFSWDGVNDHQVLPANGQLILDVSSNRDANAEAFYVSAGTTFYVRYTGSAPTIGAVYLTSLYGYLGNL